MAINYTTLLGLAQPVTGTESNVWGDVVNDSITALLDSAIAGTATINLTSGNVTLTDVDGAADQARMAILVLTGTPGVTTNVVAPSRSKTYIVVNQSNASAVLKGSATTGVTVRSGQAATCVWNGSDFEIVASGDVDGPSSATDNAVVRYDGTTGKLVQNSGVTIDDSNNVSGVVQLNATTVDTTNIEVTSLKAKDGTAAGSIADATGVVTLNSSVLTTTDINGGTIDGTTIGGSTAAAGSFTNLAYTGTLTGGTGVINIGSGQVYKDASGNVGIGTTSPQSKFNVYGAAGTAVITLSDATLGVNYGAQFKGYGVAGIGGRAEIGVLDAGTYSKAITIGEQASVIAFNTGTGGSNTEKMRLDNSGNLGLGVTPSAWETGFGVKTFEISGGAVMGATNDIYVLHNAILETGGWKYKATDFATRYQQADGQHRWFNAPSGTAGNAISFTQAMTLNASGNLLLGTSDDSARLTISGAAGYAGTGISLFETSANARRLRLYQSTSGVIYEATFGSGDNAHLWYIGGGEKARIDSSGNLGLGVTPSAWAAGKTAIEMPGGISLSQSGGYTQLSNNAFLGASSWIYKANGQAALYNQHEGKHLWYTAPSGTAGNTVSFTQAMTLTAAGHLLVGTTTTATNNRLVVAGSLGATVGNHGSSIRIVNTDTGNYASIGAGIVGTTNDGMQFSTDGVSRMVIDSSGNLLVGITTASAGSRLRVRSGGNTFSTNCIVIENSSGSNLGYIRDDGAWNTGTAAGSPYNLTTGSAANVFLDSTGFLYRSTSSLKYKTDVQNANHGLAEVMQLRPVTYKGKSEADGDKIFGGLIAEEVHEAGLTEFVQYAEDGSPDALNYGNMVSLCIKAIQEQQAIITQLQADVAALKGAA